MWDEGCIQRHCRASRYGAGRGTTQLSRQAAATPLVPSPARGTPPPARRGAARGGVQSLGGPSQFYTMSGRQTAEASPDVVTGILTVQFHDVYALIEPGSTLSYVTPFVAMGFGIEPDHLHEPFLVSTLVGESITTTRVYRGCVVTVPRGRDIAVDIIELGIVDFDVIMGMDWLYSLFAKHYCKTRTIRLEFPNETVIERKVDNVVPRGQFISYFKAAKMVKKECIYHLVWVTDTNAEALSLESILVVNEFPDVFPNELPGIPPDMEIDLWIDVIPGTQPISIPPYRMAPAELNELKEQLKDLLEKGFIQKAVKFHWFDAYEKSFQELKSRLTIAPVLALPDGTEGFVVYCDASRANVVVDTLSQKSMGSLAHFESHQRPLAREVYHLASLGVRLANSNEGGVIVHNRAESSLVAEVKEKQFVDPILAQLKEEILKHKTTAFSFGMNDGTLQYQERLCVPDIEVFEKGSWQKLTLPASKGRTPKGWWIGSKHRNSNVEMGDEEHGLCGRVNLSIAFHPQTDGQAERMIQTLEDMLRACTLDFKGSWDDHLPLIEFSYNNSFHASIQMSPFEALYGRRCRSPIGRFKVGDAELIGPNLVHQAMEKVKIMKERLKTTQSCQKSYSDVRRRDLEFKEDNWVFLKVSPLKGIMRFGKKGKLSPRYVGPYKIIQRIVQLDYKLGLPYKMSLVHLVFHVSMLRKVVGDPSTIVPVETVEVNEELSYEEVLIAILDRQVRKLRNKEIASVKVLWRNQQVEEATWEAEDEMKRKYPHLFE
ncbi:uncharacterized protein [Nicotiana sylvestris]|uniref:uncharacterized protein n=1 Tax=Nicotiana sylvestris TaxID=4096 RepID=UPI00388C3996